MEQNLEMMSTSENPHSSDKLVINPCFPKQLSDLKDNVIDNSCPSFVDKNSILTPDWEQKMKMKFPMLPLHYKSSSTILVPPPNSRLALSLDKAIEYELEHGRKLDPNMDRKKLRRTISNRLSAQRSRMKKAQYVDDLEKVMNDLQEFVKILGPQVESYKEKRKLLIEQNDSLQKLIEIRSNESKNSEIEIEQKRIEIQMLKELEKTLNNESDDSDSGPQQIQDLSLGQLPTQAYTSIGFYQFGQQIAPVNFCFEQGNEEVMTDEDNEEEADTDQYLNLEAVNVDPASD